MPPIYYLNPPPNPFWDFVAGLEDHPFFTGPPPAARQNGGWTGPAQAASEAPQAQPQAEMSEKAQGKQPYVEDPPEVDPSTVKPEQNKTEGGPRDRAFPFRGRGRFAGAFGEDDHKDRSHPFGKDKEERRDQRREERQCRRDGRDRRGPGPGPNGPPPFAFGPPFFARPPWAGPDFQGPPGPHGRHHRPGPPHEHPHPHDHGRRGPPHDIRDRDRRHGQGPPHRRCSPSRRPPFDLPEFLTKLSSKLGIDLTTAAEGLGLAQDRFSAGRTSADINFEPRADIFENTSAYTIHLSLPGAKKEDVGVEYEGEHSILRITGVVHRPEVDERMMDELVVDGRKRETGLFEKAIRLGTKRDPADIDVAGIHAKMADGVLVVRIPKNARTEPRRDVVIGTESKYDAPDYENDYSEKPVLFDAEEQASVAASDAHAHEGSRNGEINLVDMSEDHLSREKDVLMSDEKKSKEKEVEYEREKERNAQPATTSAEQLPAYTPSAAEEDDWEKFSEDSGEGEYIKIDVK